MADVELVIKIPEEVYKRIQSLSTVDYFEHDICGNSMRRIANGIPLPKGHGRLGDLDAMMSNISTSINEMTNIGIALDGDYLWAKLNDAIYNAPTVIEADREERSGEE
jgi:hypothetical protein